MVNIIIAILALVAGYYFVKKYDSIENYFFGASDEADGKVFVIWSAAAGAIVSAGEILHQIFKFDLPQWFFFFLGGAFLIVIFAMAMYDALFNTATIGRAIGKIALRLVACVIGGAMGVAGSIIVFLAICLWLVLQILSGTVSGMGKSASESSSSDSSSDSQEYEINVDGEMTVRRAKDIGGGQFRDDHGDYWRQRVDGSMEKID